MKDNKSSRQSSVTSWLLVLIGVIIVTQLFCILGEICKLNNFDSDKTESTNDAADNETTMKNWNTDIKEWSIKTDSGEEIKLHTPDGFYSLTDQYLDSLGSYYDKDSIVSDSMVVVGDDASTYSAKTVINANRLSDTFSMLKQLYGEDFKKDEMVDSEAYTYMKTGKLPEELPLNYKIDEIDTYTVDGIEFVAYEVNYDTEYDMSTDETASGSATEDTEAKKETVHTQQISCYSKTEDSVEIIIYQTDFDRDSAVKILKEFIGVSE